MTIRETFVFIKRPISDIVKADKERGRPTKLVEGSEVAYLFDGSSLDDAQFGLTADFDAPEGADWTQLLHRDPENLAALAATLARFGVEPDRLESATDWSAKPLVDLDRLKELVSKARDDGRLPRRATAQR